MDATNYARKDAQFGVSTRMHPIVLINAINTLTEINLN